MSVQTPPVFEQRITLPLSHEDREYLKSRVSETVLKQEGPPNKRCGPRVMRDTYEDWVAEVEAALEAYRKDGPWPPAEVIA